MRLIDADELLRRYDKTHVGEPGRARKLIEKAPTVGGWISVKDRLPKIMINKVLVWLEHEDLNGYIGYGHYEKFHGEEMWYDLEHGERFDKRGYIVTHWMPLPEPPKE